MEGTALGVWSGGGGSYSELVSIATDSKNVYVLDSDSRSIKVFTVDGSYVAEWSGVNKKKIIF